MILTIKGDTSKLKRLAKGLKTFAKRKSLVITLGSEPTQEEPNEELTLQLTELSEQNETLTKANEELKAKITELEKVEPAKKTKKAK